MRYLKGKCLVALLAGLVVLAGVAAVVVVTTAKSDSTTAWLTEYALRTAAYFQDPTPISALYVLTSSEVAKAVESFTPRADMPATDVPEEKKDAYLLVLHGDFQVKNWHHPASADAQGPPKGEWVILIIYTETMKANGFAISPVAPDTSMLEMEPLSLD